MTELRAPPLPAGYRLENIHGPKSIDQRHEIAGFWLKHGALRIRGRALQRVPQVLFVARLEPHALVGVSTAFARPHPELGFGLYHFRCFVAPDHRGQGLAKNLLVASARFLNERFAEGNTPNVRGMFIEVETDELKQRRPGAVWADVPFVFVGQNERGAHQRLWYFEGATIS